MVIFDSCVPPRLISKFDSDKHRITLEIAIMTVLLQKDSEADRGICLIKRLVYI